MTANFGDTPPTRLQLRYGHSLSWLEISEFEGPEWQITSAMSLNCRTDDGKGC